MLLQSCVLVAPCLPSFDKTYVSTYVFAVLI